MLPVLTPSAVSTSHNVVLCTGAPTNMVLWLTLVLRVAQPPSKLNLVFSGLETWAPIEEHEGQDSAA